MLFLTRILNSGKVYGNRSIFRIFGFLDDIYDGFLDVDLPFDLCRSLLVVWESDRKLEIEKG